MKSRDKDLEEIAKLITLKEYLGYRSIRSSLVYLEDTPFRRPKKEVDVRGLREIGRLVNSIFHCNWSDNAFEKNAASFLRKFNIPSVKKRTYLCVQKTDILQFRHDHLVGNEEIAAFLGIDRSTLRRWMKDRRFRKIPIKKAGTLYANKRKLREWRLLTIARKLGIE